jgi:pectate lyase
VTEGAASSPGGYTTYHVTKLDDDGSVGTLRDAVSESNRWIVFDLGGTITLNSQLKVEQDYLTIDGLSAPDPGITITHRVGEYHGLIVDGQRRHTHDIVIQGLRFRGVYDIDPVHVVGRAIFSTDGDCRSADCTGGISGMVIDRVTHAYASDKFTLWGKVSDVTVSNSFFYGSNKAFLVSFYGEPYDLIKEKITLHHNVFASNEERNPQLVAWITDLDYRNNIVYDWTWYGMRIKSVNVGDRGTHSVDANVVNNVFVAGGGASNQALVYQADTAAGCTQQGEVIADSGMGSLWVAGNQFPADNCDQYSTVSQERDIPAYARVTTHDSGDLCAQITPEVGAPYRTAEETSLIEEVKTTLSCQ